MPEPHDVDELILLRAADPRDLESLPTPDDPAARALFQSITTSQDSTMTMDRTRRVRRPLVVITAGAAALAVAIAGAVTILDRPSDKPQSEIVQGQPTARSTTGAITPGGSMGSCVEVYDLQTLAKREVAFDGTIQRLNGDEATFTVNQWYRGGQGDEITLAGAAGLSGLTSVGPAATLEPGTRLLVAGDGGFAWACGFTQPYDPNVARQWEEAFSR